jgi:hypothetical protein
VKKLLLLILPIFISGVTYSQNIWKPNSVTFLFGHGDFNYFKDFSQSHYINKMKNPERLVHSDLTNYKPFTGKHSYAELVFFLKPYWGHMFGRLNISFKKFDTELKTFNDREELQFYFQYEELLVPWNVYQHINDPNKFIAFTEFILTYGLGVSYLIKTKPFLSSRMRLFMGSGASLGISPPGRDLVESNLEVIYIYNNDSTSIRGEGFGSDMQHQRVALIHMHQFFPLGTEIKLSRSYELFLAFNPGITLQYVWNRDFNWMWQYNITGGIRYDLYRNSRKYS